MIMAGFVVIGAFIYLGIDRKRAIDRCTRETGNRTFCEVNL
jgi:hypothetical protein